MADTQVQEIRVKRQKLSFLKPRDTEGRDLIPLRGRSLSLGVEDSQDPRTLFLRKLVEVLTKRKIKTLSYRELTENRFPPIREPQFGAQLTTEERSIKSSSLNFFAFGRVRTKDGKTFSFNVRLELENFELEVDEKSIKSGSVALVDPLIVDLGGPARLFESTYFEFDLDGDGSKERIPLLSEGKGFVFLDSNGNSRPDGGEILGVKSGSAFGKLKSLDEDGNRWIDEGDSVFKELCVWFPRKGSYPISETRIVALYTGSYPTLFDLENSSGETPAILKNLGVYLKEDGSAGALYKVDFRV